MHESTILPPRRTIRWRRLALVLLIAAVLMAYWATRNSDDRELVIETNLSGLHVPEVHAEPLGSVGIQPDFGDAARGAKIAIRAALSKYPAGFPRRLVRTIYVVSRLTTDGSEIGGTAASGVLIVSLYGGRTDTPEGRAQIELTLHHELAHAAFASGAGSFDRLAWIGANVDGFKYGRGGLRYIKDPVRTLEYSEVLFDNGFVSNYSRSAIEEDFCEIVAVLFTADAESWKLLMSKPRLRKKATLAAEFLHLLDDRMSWEHFESLDRSGEGMSTRLVPRGVR